ncbi:MAG: response regulator [Candidatus Margulisiibacteriota bacterium]
MAKILIADDEPNIRKLTGMMFENLGMTVVLAENGQEAIDLAIAERPDLIITDVKMPQKTGFEVCRTLRAHSDLANTPIIILSAIGDEFNKITGFEEGADDYVTKPFNVDELKARVKALLARTQKRADAAGSKAGSKSTAKTSILQTGSEALDKALKGGLPVGSNILLVGKTGFGKSTFARQFVANGLKKDERVLFVAVDDAPERIRQSIQGFLDKPMSEYESLGFIRFVDAYSWSTLSHEPVTEKYAVTGSLELHQLSGLITDASQEIGQTVQHKVGGRRVVDSISSLLIHFDLPTVQRFLTQITRTAVAFGGVTTLFIIEDKTVSDETLNNIKYVMDGVIEFDEQGDQRMARVASMKWVPYDKKWVPFG